MYVQRIQFWSSQQSSEVSWSFTDAEAGWGLRNFPYDHKLLWFSLNCGLSSGSHFTLFLLRKAHPQRTLVMPLALTCKALHNLISANITTFLSYSPAPLWVGRSDSTRELHFLPVKWQPFLPWTFLSFLCLESSLSPRIPSDHWQHHLVIVSVSMQCSPCL